MLPSSSIWLLNTSRITYTRHTRAAAVALNNGPSTDKYGDKSSHQCYWQHPHAIPLVLGWVWVAEQLQYVTSRTHVKWAFYHAWGSKMSIIFQLISNKMATVSVNITANRLVAQNSTILLFWNVQMNGAELTQWWQHNQHQGGYCYFYHSSPSSFRFPIYRCARSSPHLKFSMRTYHRNQAAFVTLQNRHLVYIFWSYVNAYQQNFIPTQSK